jgi:AcrR family transcriptional regulator
MKRQNDKRIRLVTGADQLFHKQGINTTTLANIAQLAEVPLGNVYYYFKSKESIITAVIEYRFKMIKQLFEELNSIDTPKARIKALLDKLLSDSETITAFGDPLGSLCLELSKEAGELHQSAAGLMHTVVNWCEEQFNQLGKQDSAKQLALHLVASLQGISLLTATFKNPEQLRDSYAFVENWVNSI